MVHIAQGKRSDTLGFPHSRVSAPCKGKSFISIPNIECFCPFRASILWQSVTQGVASLALGCVLHWAFSPPLLKPKFEYCYSFICRLAMIKMRATARRASAAHTPHVRPRVCRSVLSVLTVDCSCVLAVWSRSASA